MNSKKCLICKKSNNTLHWHTDPDTNAIWVWCIGGCQRGYSLQSYCHTAGVNLTEFLKGDFDFQEAKPLEVTRLEWPNSYISLADPRAEEGVKYLKGRGVEIKGDMYYDLEKEAIVFPYYVGNTFCGAQTRLLKPWTNADGDTTKILTMPGTRLGLVFYNWNQDAFVTNIKAIVVCEGAINAISIQQALNNMYGGILKNPFKVVATSGCGTTHYQMDKLKEMKDAGKKIIIAFDSDEPGMKGLNKMIKNEVATHYAITGDSAIDWNDIVGTQGSKFLADFFIKNIKDITEL